MREQRAAGVPGDLTAPADAVWIKEQPRLSSRALSAARSSTTQLTWPAPRCLVPYASASHGSMAWICASSSTMGPHAAKAAEWSNGSATSTPSGNANEEKVT
jgi:hypothetical protein